VGDKPLRSGHLSELVYDLLDWVGPEPERKPALNDSDLLITFDTFPIAQVRARNRQELERHAR